MAASVIERYDSRQLSGRTVTYRYTVVGTDDLDEVLNVLDNEAPEQLSNGFPRGEPSCRPIGGTMWECEIPYSASGSQTSNDIGADPGPQVGADGLTDGGGNVAGGANPSDPVDVGMSFSTGGGTIRITQALEHIASYAPTGKTAPDHHGAINVQPDGTVDGVEVLSAKGSFNLKRSVPNMTVGYFIRAISKTAMVNHDGWKGFGIREVLFEGVDGSWNGKAWDLTFHFGYMPTRVIRGADIGPDWPNIRKRGWDYLWMEYETVDDSSSDPKKTVRRPFAAHVERVYHSESFQDFQL